MHVLWLESEGVLGLLHYGMFKPVLKHAILYGFATATRFVFWSVEY